MFDAAGVAAAATLSFIRYIICLRVIAYHDTAYSGTGQHACH